MITRASTSSQAFAFMIIAGINLLIGYVAGQKAPDYEWSEFRTAGFLCVSHGPTIQCFAVEQNIAPAATSDVLMASVQTQDTNRDECVALAVFTEARGEPELGQAAVAQTVVNRAKRLGIGACDVVTGLSQYVGVERLQRDPWLIDQVAWDRALRISTEVAAGSFATGSCRSATHFHADTVQPAWAKSLRQVCRVGGHTFYAEG